MAYNAKVVRKIEDVPEDLRDEYDDDFFSEGRSLLVIDYGTAFETHSDRGEPEDNSFGRDYYWVEKALNAAYEAGKAEKG